MATKSKNNNIKTTEDSIAAIILLLVAGFSAFVSLEWSLFSLLLKRRKSNESLNKKWAHLNQMKINHPRNRFEKKYEDGKAWCKQQEMTNHYIKSVDGLTLHSAYLKAERAERIIILSHGYRGSSYGDFANIAKFLHENNCDLLFVDQRCCGESEGEYITFGAMEHKDLVRWIYYIEKQNANRLPIYLFGTSMGGTAAIMASGNELPDSVKGFIIDCAFHSMKEQIAKLAGSWFNIHHTSLFLFRIDILCRIFAGFKMSDSDTTFALETNTRPMLFIHGALDTFVSPDNMLKNFSLCKAPKQLVVVDDARHLCSAYAAEDTYRNKIIEFLNKYDSQS